MIRAAKFVDIPEIAKMLRELHAGSKYADRCGISDKAVESMLMGAIAGMNQSGPQASHVVIAEEDGEPIGFMIGILDRIYYILDKLTANDLFLYVRPGAPVSASLRLIDSYVEWARANRKVVEIKLSWCDALPGAKRVGAVYRRKGFEQVGEIFEMRLDVPALEAAA